MANLLQCSRQTIYVGKPYIGLKELKENKLLLVGRLQIAGGGRKSHFYGQAKIVKWRVNQ